MFESLQDGNDDGREGNGRTGWAGPRGLGLWLVWIDGGRSGGGEMLMCWYWCW